MNILDSVEKTRTLRKECRTIFNNYQKVCEELSKIYQGGVKENSGNRFAEQDCYLQLVKFSGFIKKIIRMTNEYTYNLTFLYSILKHRDDCSEAAYSKSFSNFSVFVNSRISLLDSKIFSEISSVFHEMQLKKGSNQGLFKVQNIISDAKIESLGASADILNGQIEVRLN